MRPVIILLWLFLMGLPALAPAHGLYWATDEEGDILLVGHPPESEHDGHPAVPLAAELVTRLETCDEQGVWRPRGVSPRGTVTAEPAAASLVEVDFGWWSIGAEGTRAVPPERMPGVMESARTRETLKELRRPYPGWNSPFGRGLEITPLVDPFALRTGDRFTVFVTLDGRPLQDLRVFQEGESRGRTDLGGHFRLRVRHPGWQEIAVTYYQDMPGPYHAEDAHTSRLVFPVESEE